LDQDNIINDIVFILTIFGNDFVPKIPSYNVKYDFSRIIDKYIATFNKFNKKNNQSKYLIFNNKKNNSKTINLYFLKDLIRILKQDEGGNLQKVYMAAHYKNYERLRKTVNASQEDFIDVITNFLSDVREFNKDIRNGKTMLISWIF
jgi:5'-3' exonuclease